MRDMETSKGVTRSQPSLTYGQLSRSTYIAEGTCKL